MTDTTELPEGQPIDQPRPPVGPNDTIPFEDQ